MENLHNGKPSHPDLLDSPTLKKKPAPDTDAAFGGYAPSFGRRAAAGDKPPPKKGGLFDDDDDNDFFSPPKPKPSENSNLLSNLFGDSKPDTASKSRNSLEGTVFSTSTKAKPVADNTTLPWEKKAGATSGFLTQQNKPNGLTVNVPKSSFDDFDDDIEEVILWGASLSHFSSTCANSTSTFGDNSKIMFEFKMEHGHVNFSLFFTL